MITLIKKNDHLELYSHYIYKDRLKMIPGAKFGFVTKCWLAPLESLPYIEREFDGEIYYKTPRWALYGGEKPSDEIDYYFGKKDAPELLIAPYSYQRTGISFMIDRLLKFGFVLNSDEMGLGKTVESIGTLKWFYENAGIRKALVVCKKSIKTQWKEEIKKFTGWDIPIFTTRGDKKERDETYERAAKEESCILITNYHNFLNDKEAIDSFKTEFVIVDEAHSVKSHEGKMNKMIGDVARGKKVVLLTGTPVMSSPEDIYGIVSLADKNMFGSFKEYEKRYLVVDYGIYGRQVVGAKNLGELQEKIRCFMIRRTTFDVSLELPARVNSVIHSDMDELQEKMKDVVDSKRSDIEVKKDEIIKRFSLPNGCLSGDGMKLIDEINEKEKMYLATMQFIADDPLCFKALDPSRGINREMLKMIPEKYAGSEKTDALLDLVEDIVSADEKVVIFTHFSSSARLISEKIKKKFKGKNFIPCSYTGSESDDARETAISKFKSDPSCHILIGTDAMAEGLNLQIAKYLINYEQADTNAQKEQRIGRIERIGSKHRNIKVYDLVTNGSFDETKLGKLDKDKLVSESLIGG